MRNLLIPVFLLFIFACSTNNETSILYSTIEKHIVELSSDQFKGRAPMSGSEDGIVKYISGQMHEAGLEPANQGSWYQEVPIMAVSSELSQTLDIETPKGTLQFHKLTEYVAFSRKVQNEIRIDGSELIFAGYGIVAPEFGRNDYEAVDVKGKTVLVFVNDPGYGTTDEYFKGNTMTYYGRWTYKYEEAARQGAKACFIIHETGPAGYPWQVVQNNGEGTSLYLQSDDGYKNRCSLEGWISRESASKLFDACDISFEEAKKRATSKDFKPYTLHSKVYANIKSRFEYGTSKNVCGLIRGTEKPDEVVVYTAHWDHLGTGLPIEGDSIYNGASDNAGAVAWMLEIARVMKQSRPKRSVLFISVTGEESGLLGSGYYVEHPLFPMNKTVACINTDVILFLGKFNDVTVTGIGQSELDDLLRTEASKQNRYIVSDPNPEQGMYYRSDQLPFVKAGVPSLFAKGYTDAQKYGKDETTRRITNYWKEIYHKPSDEYVKSRDDLGGLAQDAELMFNIGRVLANENRWPVWYSGSEFKKIREESLTKQ